MTQATNLCTSSVTRSHQVASRRSVHAGFSLIDLLVSLAVITTLLAIMMPSLSRAQEAARRVGCASNMRQIGMALQMYAYNYADRLPDSVFLKPDDRNYSPHDSIFIYLAAQSEFGRKEVAMSRWDGIGILHFLEYLEAPQTYYCPSHAGEHAYEQYEERYATKDRDIAVNYQYRLPANTRYFSDFRSSTTILADAMRTQSDYNHVVGNYMFKADLSVTWYSDANGLLFASLPGDLSSPNAASNAVQGAWEMLDGKSTTPQPSGGGGAGGGSPGGPIAGGGSGG